MGLLKPGGRLAYVVTNKWMKAGYGEPLRTFFGEETWIETVVDFGHAKQFFKDADVFPCFVVARRPTEGPKPKGVRVCVIPRELVRMDDLKMQVATDGIIVEHERFGVEFWNLEPKNVTDLIEKIARKGKPLTEFSGIKPYYGIKTGMNEAFLISHATKDALIKEDPKSSKIIKPYLRGQDIKRWSPEWAGLWMIFARKGIDIDDYPAVKNHLGKYREQLEPKPNNWHGDDWPGRKPGLYHWFEIQDPIDYWPFFEGRKIVYQEIQYHPAYCLVEKGYYGNNKTFILTTEDLYLLGLLNSPLILWYNWRCLPHMKDEALTPLGLLMEGLPIATPREELQKNSEEIVQRLIEIAVLKQSTRGDLLDWLKVQHEIVEPNTKLQHPFELNSDAFVAEVKKARGKTHPLSAAAVRGLREEHGRTIDPARALAAEARGLEEALSDLVNEAYGLTPDEVRLMWDTARVRPVNRIFKRVRVRGMMFGAPSRRRGWSWRAQSPRVRLRWRRTRGAGMVSAWRIRRPGAMPASDRAAILRSVAPGAC